ncbi:MAG: NADP-dependent phosphogluconate dehydrogenase [Rhizobacter sp.]|nr:NADP-dependent phosphogluconate dehydrogenase [Ferruginibacter sp.]
MKKFSFGIIGLGTMGGNFILNINDHGFSVAGYDKDKVKTDALNAERSTDLFEAFSSLPAFMDSLETPRNIILLVPAGKVVDIVINELKPYWGDNDVIIDCGNSHFTDTQRRVDELSGEKIHFMGMGISGGETGARYGASIMPGGDREAHARIAPMLNAVCAKVDGEPCTAYMGNGAAGHYVKMVHNGIEYAIMQTLSECYHLMKVYGQMSNAEIQQTFDAWNKGRLQSFLVEITAAIFKQPDDLKSGELVDSILDTAAQKGTGAWTSQDAANVASPIPVIDAAVSQRIISAMRAQRQIAAKQFPAEASEVAVNKEALLKQLEAALYSTYIVCYAQGFQMLANASEEYKYNISLSSVASIWRGGCIIRAAMLVKIKEAFAQDADLKNIMLNDFFAKELNEAKASFKSVVSQALATGIPVPALSSALNYYLSYHSGWLPANVIQAQRDFFGAHTYQRNDREGTFHTNWNQTIH